MMTLKEYFVKNAKLKKEWVAEKNNVLPENVVVRSRDKFWWRCSNGHEWTATLDSRVYTGRNCPYCANQAVIPGENDIATIAPEMAHLWHPTRNGDLLPSNFTPGSRARIWWKCEHDHEWQASCYSIKAGSNCPYCAGKKPIPGKTDLATTHPHIVSIWSVRNTLNPTELTAGSKKRIWLVCDQGHEWETSVAMYATLGCGCPYCSGRKAIPGETDLATLHPELMAEWDSEKNSLLDPTTILPGSHTKVWWTCSLGHSYEAAVFSRTREKGTGCPYCTGRQVLPGFNDLATLLPQLAEEWAPALNEPLKPDEVSLGSNRRVWWQCKEGHIWPAVIYSRTKLNGTGCPLCSGNWSKKRAERYAAMLAEAKNKLSQSNNSPTEQISSK